MSFAAFEVRHYAGVQPVDKDPATYVREVEEGDSGTYPGSLSIGSLRQP
ncbi:MAG: hypothetical protein WAK82_30665 [Streptosporangiaceae bacterium]